MMIVGGSRDCLGRRSGRDGNAALPPPFAVSGECCLRSCLTDAGSVGFHPPTDSCFRSGVAEGGLQYYDSLKKLQKLNNKEFKLTNATKQHSLGTDRGC